MRRFRRCLHPALEGRGIKNKRFKKIADPFDLAVALDNAATVFFLWLDAPERQFLPRRSGHHL
jgi:hypothetical protein